MASFSATCPKTAALFAPQPKNTPKSRNASSVVSFHSDLKSGRALIAGSSSSYGFQASKGNKNEVMRVSAQLNEVSLQEPSNSAPASEKKPEESTKTETSIPDVDAITAFMNQVADLVELVDSRDICELQLKQQDCELLIRKKEALPPPPGAQMVMMQAPQPQQMYHPPQQAAPAPPPPAPAPSAPAAQAALPSPAKPKSSTPPLKSPIAGTFYSAPSPGSPPFVKVGDKVQKGQVLCIVEAMKLMNEITAERAGTVVEILVENGKPVSADMPLFIIE